MRDITLDLARAFAEIREAHKTKRLFILFNTKTHNVTRAEKLSDKQFSRAINKQVIIVDTNNQQVFDYEQGWRAIADDTDDKSGKKKSRRAERRSRRGRKKRSAKRDRG